MLLEEDTDNFDGWKIEPGYDDMYYTCLLMT